MSTCLIYALNYLQQPGEQPLYTFQVGKFLETDLASKWSKKKEKKHTLLNLKRNKTIPCITQISLTQGPGHNMYNRTVDS